MKGKETASSFFHYFANRRIQSFSRQPRRNEGSHPNSLQGKKKHVLLWQGATAGAQQREPLKCVDTRPIHFQGCAPTFCREKQPRTRAAGFSMLFSCQSRYLNSIHRAPY